MEGSVAMSEDKGARPSQLRLPGDEDPASDSECSVLCVSMEQAGARPGYDPYGFDKSKTHEHDEASRGLESVDLGEEEEGWGAKGAKWGHVTVRGPREETKMETTDSDEEQGYDVIKPNTQGEVCGDVASTLRSLLAIGGFRCVLEVVVVCSVANGLLSMACIAAEGNGWFMGYNTLSSALSRRPSPLDGSYGYGLVDVHVGWDRFSLTIDGRGTLTTRFLDDVSPIGYVLGCLTFLGHLCSVLLSLFTLHTLYQAIVCGGVSKLGGRHVHMRTIAFASATLGLYLCAFGVMGLPAAIIRDFTQTLGKQLLGAGFEVRAVWAYGCSCVVTLLQLSIAYAVGRRAPAMDRAIAASASSQ